MLNLENIMEAEGAWEARVDSGGKAGRMEGQGLLPELCPNLETLVQHFGSSGAHQRQGLTLS